MSPRSQCRTSICSIPTHSECQSTNQSEREREREREIDHQTQIQNVHISLLAVLVLRQHFWTHVNWSADACHGLCLLWLDGRDAKVCNLACPCAIHQQILWLQVSMDQLARVQVTPCHIDQSSIIITNIDLSSSIISAQSQSPISNRMEYQTRARESSRCQEPHTFLWLHP